ncbi:GNAT family N-acetyltransferase [Oceanotoga teriensis]|uniref:GNAT family N-acetyltransferase n=1 Tax=Oceanotoga teriensis TaxID=515440 RepID=UPI00271366A9|nr:N-acetyltransferase [Oceanotoga teriensis]MDO7976518.1 N-acetyltransferase [Oceanotoga teriensis]
MKINIRKETIKDYKKVETVAREAFWNLYFPGCREHYIIHKMRNHPDFIEDLSFIIEVDDEIIGGIFFAKAKIISNNKEYDAINFGPVFIHPKYHRMGIGRKLITHSIELAKKMGHRAILILGNPKHYETYGFLGGKHYNISMPDGKFYKGLLVLPLYENALKNISGYVSFSEIFEINDDEVDSFDKNFDYKEKKYQESQKEFEKTSTMLDD